MRPHRSRRATLTTKHTKDGVVLGRFQPLHLGHMEYLARAKERCRRLFIGVTNPDSGSRIHSDTDPDRSKAENNPFSYVERALMIEASLLDEGWSPSDFFLIPAPIREPEKLLAYIPSPASTIAFITVYDAWGDQKAGEMRDLGYEVDVMWRRSHSDRLTSGTEIRKLMRAGAPWEHLAPAAVSRIMKQSTIDGR